MMHISNLIVHMHFANGSEQCMKLHILRHQVAQTPYKELSFEKNPYPWGICKRVSLITGLLITGLDWTGLES